MEGGDEKENMKTIRKLHRKEGEMKRFKTSVFLLAGFVACLTLLVSCGGGGGDGGGGGGGGTQTTTKLQHPYFPSTVGDTWTWNWYTWDFGMLVDTTTETVTAVSENSLTMADNLGEEWYFEIKEDPQGRKYVVETGGTGYTLAPPVVINTPDLNK